MEQIFTRKEGVFVTHLKQKEGVIWNKSLTKKRDRFE